MAQAWLLRGEDGAMYFVSEGELGNFKLDPAKVKEIDSALSEKQSGDTELSDAQLEDVAGGVGEFIRSDIDPATVVRLGLSCSTANAIKAD